MTRSTHDAPDNPSRRSFLKGAGIGLGVAAGAGLAAVPATASPYSRKYPVVPDNHVELPSHGTRVIIIGGGLAGLQAGVELSARGFVVQVLEKTGLPGGKLKTWRDRSFGPADDPAKRDPRFRGYVREHGIHAVWGFYNNLREFMHRYGWGLQDMPHDNALYLFMDEDGSRGALKTTNLPQPYGSLFQLFGMMELDEYFDAGEKRRIRRFMRHAISFDFSDAKQRDYLDSITVEQWAAKFEVPEGFTHKIMDALTEMAFFDNASQASALAVANLFQLAAGSPRDMDINLYLNPPGETFLQPMVDYIESRGGQVLFNTELTGFELDGGELSAVKAAQIGDGQAPMTRCSVCGALLGPGGEHLEKCPMCGANGDMIRQLAPAELRERRYEAEYFISALDIPAAKRLFGRGLGEYDGHDYFRRIQKLSAVHVYVVNLWYEGQDFWERAVRTPDGGRCLDFFATGFQDLGITLNWSMPQHFHDRQEMIVKDYEGRDVSVIETQIANAEGISHLSDEQIVERVHAELKRVMPDLPRYRSSYVNRWRNYTTYRPGDTENRPTLQSPIDNLLFIGDMVHVEHPAVFMEKTNVTAKMATNLLLDRIGRREGKITILPSGTPGPIASLIKHTGSVFP